MPRVLDVGCGPASIADVQIDIHLYENMKKYTYIVQDAMMEDWKVDDESFTEVRMEMFLEHCPVIVKEYTPSWQWITHYPRIHCMKEAYRALKHGGILKVSVPGAFETHSQDPTHDGPQITEGFFNYFCGEWGGGEPGSFTNDSYGIDFKFKKLSAVNDGFALTMTLQKG